MPPVLRYGLLGAAGGAIFMMVYIFLLPIPEDETRNLAIITTFFVCSFFWWVSGVLLILALIDTDFISDNFLESSIWSCMGPLVIIPIGFAYVDESKREELKIKFCPKSLLPLYVGHDFINDKARKTFLKRIKKG